MLRVWNNDYGLPYVYNYDEETHFVSKAVDMFGGGFDPDLPASRWSAPPSCRSPSWPWSTAASP